MKFCPKPRIGGLYSLTNGYPLTIYPGRCDGHMKFLKLMSNDIIMVTKLDIHKTPSVSGGAECYFITFIFNEKVYGEWMTFPTFWSNNFRDAGSTRIRTLT